MGEIQTFFEQVPVETVKRICQQRKSRPKRAGINESAVENPAERIEARKAEETSSQQ
jgi:hypothetical protein